MLLPEVDVVDVKQNLTPTVGANFCETRYTFSKHWNKENGARTYSVYKAECTNFSMKNGMVRHLGQMNSHSPLMSVQPNMHS